MRYALAFVVLATSVSFSAEPLADVNQARRGYAEAIEAARTAFVESFTTAVKQAAADGDIDDVTTLVKQKTAFEEQGTLPASPRMKPAVTTLQAAEKTARANVVKAYRTAIAALATDGKIDDVTRLGDELKSIEAGGDVPAASGVVVKSRPTDPVLAELQEAKDEYASNYSDIEKGFLAEIDARILELSKAGQLDQVAIIQAARKEFASDGKFEKEPRDDRVKFSKAKFDRALLRYRRTLTSAYRKAIGRYKRSDDDTAAERLEAELADWSATVGRPTGRARVVDLIRLVDLAKDGKPQNKWALRGGTLICTAGTFVPKVVFPYEPPAEYDLRMEFSQPKLRNDVGLIMPNGVGGSFHWALGGDDGRMILPVKGGERVFTNRVRGAFQPNVRYTTVVQVRKNGIRTSINGKPIYEYRGPREALQIDGWHRIEDVGRLAVYADDPTVFHVITIREVTGTGKRTR